MAETRKRKAGKRGEETLEVVCRVAPYRGPDPCIVTLDDETIRYVPPPGLLRRNREAYIEKVYKFGHVFDNYDSQRDVFNRCCGDFVEDLVRGRNSLLFTYGVTGSGKTYTMTGKFEGDASGILPRAADVLFNSLPKLADKCIFYPDGKNGFAVRSPLEAARERLNVGSGPRYKIDTRRPEVKEVYGFPDGMLASVFVSYVEIYKDYCYDLLDESLTENRVGDAKLLRAPADGPAFVERLTEVEVQSSDEVLVQYLKAQDRRKVGKTVLNHQSSRSHSIFNIRLVMAPQDEYGQPSMDATKIRTSQMSLVDLAGSERAKRTGNTGERLNEACNINESLLCLRQCFDALRKNQRAARRNTPPVSVPFREQKLTLLFKSFFEGRGRIRMIICLHPQPADYEENGYVLDFAELAKSVDVPEAVLPDLPFAEMNNLPYRRRDIVRWYTEIDAIVDPAPLTMEIFDEPPAIELDGPEDGESLRRLREHYTSQASQRHAYMNTVQHNAIECTAKLKERLCFSDLDRQRLEDAETEVEELRQYSANVNARNKNLQRENNALKVRLSAYEGEQANERRRDEDARLREERLRAHNAQDRLKIDNVLGLVEAPVSSHARMLRGTEPVDPTQQQPSASKVAALRKQYDDIINNKTPTRADREPTLRF